MKVILLKEVKGLGHVGEIKEVAAGYGRNFLIPKNLAAMLTKYSLNVLGARKNKQEKLKKQTTQDKRKLAEKINQKKFIIQVKADEKGGLYAKLSRKEIVDELARNGFNIEAGEVKLKEAIKKIGQKNIELNLGNRKTEIKLEIVRKS